MPIKKCPKCGAIVTECRITNQRGRKILLKTVEMTYRHPVIQNGINNWELCEAVAENYVEHVCGE